MLTDVLTAVGVIILLPIPETTDDASWDDLRASNVLNNKVFASTEHLSPQCVMNWANSAKSVFEL